MLGTRERGEEDSTGDNDEHQVQIYSFSPCLPTQLTPALHFLQKQWGEVDRISRKFILCDNVCNSHYHSVLQSIAITRRKWMLITLTD